MTKTTSQPRTQEAAALTECAAGATDAATPMIVEELGPADAGVSARVALCEYEEPRANDFLHV